MIKSVCYTPEEFSRTVKRYRYRGVRVCSLSNNWFYLSAFRPIGRFDLPVIITTCSFHGRHSCQSIFDQLNNLKYGKIVKKI